MLSSFVYFVLCHIADYLPSESQQKGITLSAKEGRKKKHCKVRHVSLLSHLQFISHPQVSMLFVYYLRQGFNLVYPTSSFLPRCLTQQPAGQSEVVATHWMPVTIQFVRPSDGAEQVVCPVHSARDDVNIVSLASWLVWNHDLAISSRMSIRKPVRYQVLTFVLWWEAFRHVKAVRRNSSKQIALYARPFGSILEGVQANSTRHTTDYTSVSRPFCLLFTNCSETLWSFLKTLSFFSIFPLFCYISKLLKNGAGTVCRVFFCFIGLNRAASDTDTAALL